MALTIPVMHILDNIFRKRGLSPITRSHALAHSTNGTLSGVHVLARKEAIEPLHIEQRLS